jgi:hypothetical protein
MKDIIIEGIELYVDDFTDATKAQLSLMSVEALYELKDRLLKHAHNRRHKLQHRALEE